MTLIHDFRLHSHSNPAGRMICSCNQIVCLPIHCPLVSLSHDLITTNNRRASHLGFPTEHLNDNNGKGLHTVKLYVPLSFTLGENRFHFSMDVSRILCIRNILGCY